MPRGLPGGQPISAEAAVGVLDWLLDELKIPLSPERADWLVWYVCYRYERDDAAGARRSLLQWIDPTAVYRVEAMLHASSGEV